MDEKALVMVAAMPRKPLLPMIVLSCAASIVVMVFAAINDARVLSGLTASISALFVVYAMVRANILLWRAAPARFEEGTQITSARNNALLTAAAYAWSATAMLAVYALSPLSWQHWWQYGAGMALAAACTSVYAHQLSRPHNRLQTPRALDIAAGLAALQGLAVCAGLIFLIISGKPSTLKADWAANQIFLAGGAMLLVISILSVVTRRKIARAAP